MTDIDRNLTSTTGRSPASSSPVGGTKPSTTPQRDTNVSSGRGNLGSSVDRTRAQVRSGVDTVRTGANDAVQQGIALVNSNPMASLAGAVAVGALAAALLPNTRTELRAAGPIGGRARDSFGKALTAARSAGGEQISASGLTVAALTTGYGSVIGAIVKAALAATTAAKESVADDDILNSSATSAPKTQTPGMPKMSDGGSTGSI